jgi:hypothetical protein
MSEEPMEMIEKYLERVRIYLPIDSEDTLTEMRTHLIQEAESIGQGKITRGSAMLAIERFGDPKEAANAYAGTGKKVGPIPAEYLLPTGRIIMAFAALAIAFGIGAYFVGISLSTWGLPAFTNWPFSIPLMVVFWIGLAVFIIGLLSILDRFKAPTEKTTLEGVLGVGTGVFTPKSRLDAIGEFVAGVIFALVLLLPQVRICFDPSYMPVLNVAVILMAVGALRGFLFFRFGENSLNLLLEAALAAVTIALCTVLATTGWPLVQVWSNMNGVWYLYPLSTLYGEVFFLYDMFSSIWTFIVFVLAVTSSWELVISGMKISMYMKAGKGWWWKGNWAPKHYSALSKWLRRLSGRREDSSAARQSA